MLNRFGGRPLMKLQLDCQPITGTRSTHSPVLRKDERPQSTKVSSQFDDNGIHCYSELGLFQTMVEFDIPTQIGSIRGHLSEHVH